MNDPSPIELPAAVCDALLRLTPVNVFLFDTSLVCRYAAPIGDEFEGRRPDQLLGQAAAEILPPARNGLGPTLERAARDAEAWQDGEYRFNTIVDGAERSCCWSIQIAPVRIDRYRGVLVSWSDIIAQTDERDRLSAEVEACRHEARERNDALVRLFSDLRNAITPLSGYLQVIARRPDMLGGRSPSRVIGERVLPRIAELLDLGERLRRPPIYTKSRDEG